MGVEIKNKNPIEVSIVSAAPAYAKISGILALIFAILSFLIPIFGTLFITPLAIFFCAIALWGGARGTGIATIIIVVVNLFISPVFWANLYVSTTEPGADSNRFLAFFDIVGILCLFIFLFFDGRKTK